MIVVLSRGKTKQSKATAAWRTTYVDFGANDHMVVYDSVLFTIKKPSRASIGTASSDVVKAESEGISEFHPVR